MMGFWPGGMELAMVLITLITVAAIALVVVLLAGARPTPRPGPHTEAEEALRMRYAPGEIERPELDERLAVLRSAVRRS